MRFPNVSKFLFLPFFARIYRNLNFILVPFEFSLFFLFLRVSLCLIDDFFTASAAKLFICFYAEDFSSYSKEVFGVVW